MKLLSPHKVAAILDINYRKVLELIHLKELPAIKILRQYKITETDLISFIENNRV
jgi:excisionase family DNA binding protein